MLVAYRGMCFRVSGTSYEAGDSDITTPWARGLRLQPLLSRCRGGMLASESAAARTRPGPAPRRPGHDHWHPASLSHGDHSVIMSHYDSLIRAVSPGGRLVFKSPSQVCKVESVSRLGRWAVTMPGRGNPGPGAGGPALRRP
jgi:hypothetical protein